MAYPLAAAAVSFLWRRMRRGFAWALVAAAAGDLIVLACGALWLAVFIHTSAFSTLTMAVLPFLPGDALKVAAAAGMAAGYFRLRHGTA
jgi:biotin transport system substrate-specific component